MAVDPTFGPWLREQRRALGLTQVELAAHFGVTAHSLSMWENSRMQCQTPGAIRLAIEALKARAESSP